MRTLGDETVNDALEAVWGRVSETSATTRASIEKYAKIYREAPLWAHAKKDGQVVYDKLCATCHVMNGKGINLGPELTGSWKNGVEYFLENVIDPNAVIGESFQLNIVTRKDGTVVSGMPAGETADALTIRTIVDSVTIPIADIQSRQVLEQSMMPPGLLDTIPQKEAIDLLKFLSTP